MDIKKLLVVACGIVLMAPCLGGCGGSSCQDDCQAGTKTCNGNTLLECGNFDNDSCLEWGNPYDCPGACEVDQCVQSCTDQCPAGTRRCSGTQYQVCRSNPATGCTEWGQPQSCPTGQTCTGDGLCTDACTDQCQPGQKQCVAGRNAYQECVCPADDCCDWGDPVDCTGGESCANGECVTCANDCEPAGKRECVGDNAYHVCGNLDSDPCFEWSDPTNCPAGDTCYNGVCGEPCTDECSGHGQRQCTTDERSYQTCGNYDADPCLDWGDATACAPNELCQDGACIFNCVDECAAGSKRCAGNGYQTCGGFDEDPCTEWSPVTDCKHNETCSNGLCSVSCTDECCSSYDDLADCPAAQKQECTGFQAYAECGQFDHDGCWDWGPAQQCNLWERCREGECVIICFDECDPAGTQQCAGDGYQVCGDYDWDACLEWGDVIACEEGELCSNGQCTTMQCEDDCAVEGLRECYSETGYRTCGQYDSDECLDWSQVTNCGANERCVDGDCQAVCQDECVAGEIGCVTGANARWVCNDADGDGCLEMVEIGCTQDQTCVEGACVSDCVDDAFEENDGPDAAAALAGSQSGLVICPDDDDWYEIILGANEGLKATVQFTHADGDLDMALYRASDLDNPLDVSAGVSDSETVITGGGTPDVYLLKVYGFAGAANDYDLFLDIVPQGECLDDSFEENDGMDEAQSTLDGIFTDLMICAGDDDWYIHYLFEGEDFIVDIYFTHADGDLDLEVLDSNGELVDFSESEDDDEHLTIQGVAEGIYYVRVFGFEETVENTYDMSIEYGAPCTDDQYEPNDTRDTATPVESGTIADLVLCGNNVDWYAVEVGEGDDLLASISFTHSEQGDLDLELFDASGNLLDYSYTVTDDETVGAEALAAGTYYLRVTGYQGSENTYGLEVVY